MLSRNDIKTFSFLYEHKPTDEISLQQNLFASERGKTENYIAALILQIALRHKQFRSLNMSPLRRRPQTLMKTYGRQTARTRYGIKQANEEVTRERMNH